VLEIFWQNVKEVLSSLASRFSAQILGLDELSYWLWLAGALIAIDLLYRCWNRPASESFWYSAPWRIYTHASAVLDYKFLVVERLITAFIVAPMLVSALALGNWGSKILVSWLGPGPGWKAGVAALVMFAAIRLLLFDIGHYISHYLQHKVPFFWEFHKVHHAAEVLTPVTAFRVHPLENIMDSVFQGPLQALGLAVFYYLYGGQQSVTFVGTNAIVFFYYLIDNARHTHLWISFGPKLEHVFSSPAQHQIHHSTAPQHLDTNFSKYFSFLDWIGGTLYVPKKEEALDFGLSEGPDPELKTVWSLYWVPMRRAIRGLLRSYAPPSVTDSPNRVISRGVAG
jgi:sterol desaturase/sphingolipid hydroxylase (fatty acid hydroxylase superfamily)